MSITRPSSNRWFTVGSYPKPRVTDRRIEFALRWRDREKIHPTDPEPRLRGLWEILFVIHAIAWITIVYLAARDAAESRQSQPSTPAVHAR